MRNADLNGDFLGKPREWYLLAYTKNLKHFLFKIFQFFPRLPLSTLIPFSLSKTPPPNVSSCRNVSTSSLGFPFLGRHREQSTNNFTPSHIRMIINRKRLLIMYITN
jgi:hypothetical protein